MKKGDWGRTWEVRIVQNYMNFVRGKRFLCLWVFLIPISWLVRWWIDTLDFLSRHGLRRIAEPPMPVISVGNLTYGGTNKTPFVEMLCRRMRSCDIAVGVVSRGYGSNNPDVRVIEEGKVEGVEASRRFVGDEPLLLSARLPDVPVAVSRDRMKGLRELHRRKIRLAVADDAFQHRRLARDVDIVLIDATCPFGSGRPIPAGILREPLRALKRAHIVVVTKTDQIDAFALSALRRALAEFVPETRIFDARLSVAVWALWRGEKGLASDFHLFDKDIRGRKLMAFSAIGNPGSFIRTLVQEGAQVVGVRHFRDHHVYSEEDMAALCGKMAECGAEFLTCTEKDIYNLPPSWREGMKKGYPSLLVPRVATVLDAPGHFMEALTGCLRPRLVVASNGYGEDAIGVLLAEKLRKTFPAAEVLAFPLVGKGQTYKLQGFSVATAPSVTPSGGVVKYRLRDLWGDIRSGLLGHIRDQQDAWHNIAHKVRTPICVGDVYLLMHTLWGQGVAPLFVATAKTVRLSGHSRLERFIIRRYSRRTWTRDSDSADQLTASGADAIYSGNPIMDLLGEGLSSSTRFTDAFDLSARPRIVLLPGSRTRAYEEVTLLLDAVEILQSRKICDYVMVRASTLSLERLIDACEGWELEKRKSKTGETAYLMKNGIEICLHQGEVSTAARGARLLIGLGGTANQLCAGMGIPVVSIDEKGKRVQKKLLGDSEILVEPTALALTDCALKILTTPELHKKMSFAGQARMGSPGALDSVVRYASDELGWSARCEVYEKLWEMDGKTCYNIYKCSEQISREEGNIRR